MGLFDKKKGQEIGERLKALSADGGQATTKACDTGVTDAGAAAIRQLGDATYDYVTKKVAQIERELDAAISTQRAAIERLGAKLQLLLLEDGREIVDVPEHMEIRKAAKAK